MHAHREALLAQQPHPGGKIQERPRLHASRFQIDDGVRLHTLAAQLISQPVCLPLFNIERRPTFVSTREGGPCPALSMVIAYTQRPAVALILIRDEAHPWAEPAQLGRKKKPSVDRPDLVNVLVVVTDIARPAATFGHVEAHVETMHASARNTVG